MEAESATSIIVLSLISIAIILVMLVQQESQK